MPASGSLIIGMSHVACIKAALSETEKEHVDVQIVNKNNWKRAIFSKYGETENLNADPDKVFLCIEGNQHNVFSLIEHPTKYTLDSLDALSRTGSERIFVSVNMMADILAVRLQEGFEIETELNKRFSNSTVVHIAPPPPLSSEDIIKTNPGIFKDSIKRGISPKKMRRAIYDIQIGLSRENAAKIGADYMDVPEGTKDGDGLLKREYCGSDPTHANPKYGRIVLDHMLEIGV